MSKIIYEYELQKDNLEFAKLVPIKEFKIKNEKEASSIINILKKEYKLGNSFVEKSFLGIFNNGELVGIYQLSQGSQFDCNMYPSIISLVVLMMGATEFAVYHNHPTGECYPSDDDIDVKELLELMGKMMGIGFVGSYIITKDSYVMIYEGGNE